MVVVIRDRVPLIRRFVLLAVVAACACQTPSRASREICPNGLQLVQQKNGARLDLSAANHCHVAMLAELSILELDNLRALAAVPVQRHVAVGSQVPMLTLERIDPSAESGFRSLLRGVYYGSVQPARDSTYLYAFPFAGSEPRRLAQGIDGPFTHSGRYRYAFDFEMPIGTPVVAARGGVVLSVVDGFSEGGLDESRKDEGNGVFVLHDDGTVAGYGHLSPGIKVQEGDDVDAGDLLGLSGNSGFTQGPHLHFDVSTQLSGEGFETIPIRFQGDVLPLQGERHGPYAGASARVGE